MSVPWTTALLDVRKILSDGPTDKLAYRKKVLGQADGSNLTFKTFEMRRISTLAGAAGTPIGVFVNNTLRPITGEDLASGEFYMSAAANDGDLIVATYYSQWFNDDEITEFLNSASQWISSQTDFTQIADNLQPAAKAFATSEAYRKLSLRFSVSLSETYQLFETPDPKQWNPVAAYSKMAADHLKMAFELRDDVYKDRQGQAKAPLFANISGGVRDPSPNS